MKKLIIAGGSILLVLAVIFLGAGWYYSGEIISGLTIEGPAEEYPYRVTAVSGDTITYQVPADIDDPTADHNTTNRVGMAFGIRFALRFGPSIWCDSPSLVTAISEPPRLVS